MAQDISHQDIEKRLAHFFHKYLKIRVPKNEMLLFAGEDPRGVYYLEEGYVREYDISAKSGNEVTLHVYSPGSFFPLTWAINNTKNKRFFRALDECTLYIVPKKDVIDLLKRDGEVLFDLAQRLLSGLDGLSTRLPLYAFTDARGLVLSELLYLGKHFGAREGNKLTLNHQFTHQAIADLTGSVRETVSVVIEKLRAEDIIGYEGKHIVINDVRKAEAEIKKRL